MSDAPLITPIKVSACVFSSDSDTLETLGMDYKDPLNHFLTPEPPILYDPSERLLPHLLHQRGVTLMWSHPYALRAGLQPTEGDLRFQPLPNRWLVVRTNTTETNGSWTSNAWIVASDYLRSETGQLTVFERGIDWALPDAAGSDFREDVLGATMEVKNFVELGPSARGAMDPLTVNSAGTEFFVSSEPFARNVYSFRDPLSDFEFEDAQFSYSVVGWYDDPSIDPIAGLSEAANGDVQKFVDELFAVEKWTSIKALDDVPATSLYFGAVNNVKWTYNRQPENEAPSRENVLVVAGQSVEQTVDTMLEYASGDEAAPFAKELNRLGLRFSAGLRDILDNFEDMGGLSKQADEEHLSGFSKLRNETVWSITEPQRVDGEDEAYVSVPAPIRGSLAALNAKETMKFNLIEEVQEKVGAVADTLWKAGRLKAMGANAFPTALGSMEEYWENIRRELGYFGLSDASTLAGSLNDAIDLITELENGITALVATIEADLVALAGDFSLQSNSGGRHWGTVDPVLMLTTNEGSLLPANGDPLYFGESELEIGLAVAPDELVTLELDTGPVNLKMEQIYALLDWQNGNPAARLATQSPDVAPWVKTLIAWSMLGDPSIGPHALEAVTGVTTSAPQLRDGMYSSALQTGLIYDFQTNEDWSQPWFPLYMEWRMHLTHFPMFKADGTTNWQFDGRDYELTATANGDGTGMIIEGRTMISSHVRQTIGDALGNSLKDMGVDQSEVSQILAELNDWNFITQRVSGLSETMTLRESELKPIGFESAMTPPVGGDLGTVPSPAPWDVAQDYQNLPGVRNLSLPSSMDEWNPNNTRLFRDMSGHQMVIDQLVVYDRFGQTLHVAGKFDYQDEGRLLTPENMAVSESLSAEHNLTIEQPRSPQVVIQSPPRVLQPVRVDLDIEPATVTDKGDFIALNNPICGFVTLNRYNKEIQVFDRLGTLLGAMHPGLGNQTVFEPLSRDVSALSDLETIDPDLFNFVTAIVDSGDTKRFDDFSALLDAAGWRIDPGTEREAYISVLTGEVLALYRAQVNFQSAGDPIRNPFRYFPFEDQIQGNNLPSYSEQDFPFLLGDVLDPDDGLVGYFLDGEYDNFYTPYVPADEPLSSYVQFVDGATAPTHRFAEGPRNIVVLANPHGHVQLRSGVAPSSFLELAPEHWRNQIAVMNPSLSFGPLLTEYEIDGNGDVTNIMLPQSNIQDGHLHWKIDENASIPVSQLGAATGATTRPKAFLWGRVVFDLTFNSESQGE